MLVRNSIFGSRLMELKELSKIKPLILLRFTRTTWDGSRNP